MARHRSDLKSYKRGKKRLLCTSREIVKFDDAKIILIEMFPCGSKAELFARERYWIEILNCVNKIVPGRSDKEYREDNKERISKNQKLYRERNIAKLSKYSKIYRKTNKEAIRQHELKKEVCDCGKTFTHCNKARHGRSKLHQSYLQHMKEYKEIISLHENARDIMKMSGQKDLPQIFS